VTERRLDEEERRAVEALGRGRDGRSTDIASGGGAPAWLSRSLAYCTRCGAELAPATLPEENRERLACAACGHIAYINPRLVVTTLPVTDAGEVVLLRRGIEPGYGAWAQPGGFLEVDETVAEGAARETLEETGLVVKPGELVGIYSRLEAAVVVLVFGADELPWDGIGFKTSWWAIHDWVRLRHPEVPLPERFRGHEAF